MYQGLYDKTKNIIRQDTHMKFYEALRQLFLETDTSGVGMHASLVQVMECRNCG